MPRRPWTWPLLLLLAACGGGGGGAPAGPSGPPPPELPPFVTVAPLFLDITEAAGLLDTGTFPDIDWQQHTFDGKGMIGGACAGDFDGDGWLDVYQIRGQSGRNRLWRNKGDGTFEDVAAAAGVDILAEDTCGPVFADYDGDGRLDLFVGGVLGTHPRLFRNLGGTFVDVTTAAGLVFTRPNSVSAAFGDYDRDGDLDLYVTHWETNTVTGPIEHLWRNRGDGTFEDVSALAGITAMFAGQADYSFTPNFTDIDGDGWLDVLLVADFKTSRILRNQGDGTFADITTAVISDRSGMGSAVGDYDNDGDLDWFVSSISLIDEDPSTAPPEDLGGNRLYRNAGDGTYEDVTTEAGVRFGWWGWGSAFVDVNNDCWLDIVHTNGWFGRRGTSEDPTRLFVSDGEGSFDEVAEAAGLVDRRQGRGIVCFDFDRDGDIDVFQANLNESARLFRNDTPSTLNHLGVALQGLAPNVEGIGARVYVTLGGLVQMREIRNGNNYVSANAAEAHFGLGPASTADAVRIVWHDGAETLLTDVPAATLLVIPHPDR